MEDDFKVANKTSVGKFLFNILIVSLTITVLGYAINFYFAAGYLLVLAVHEMGHYAAARRLNVKVLFGGFTPFGAYIVHEETNSCRENAIIALGGPCFGGLLGLAYYLVYSLTGESTYIALSFISVILNLANLIPVKPLDGGHVAEAISPILCYMGFPFLLYMLATTQRLKAKILLSLVLMFGAYQAYVFTKKYKKDPYFHIARNAKFRFTAFYFMLLSALAASALYFYSMQNLDELIAAISKR